MIRLRSTISLVLVVFRCFLAFRCGDGFLVGISLGGVGISFIFFEDEERDPCRILDLSVELYESRLSIIRGTRHDSGNKGDGTHIRESIEQGCNERGTDISRSFGS